MSCEFVVQDQKATAYVKVDSYGFTVVAPERLLDNYLANMSSLTASGLSAYARVSTGPQCGLQQSLSNLPLINKDKAENVKMT